MVLRGFLGEVAKSKCKQCGKEYYAAHDRRRKHSKKDFIECLYTSNLNLENANRNLANTIIAFDKLKEKYKFTEKIVVDEEGRVMVIEE